ncbi:MAG: pyridoxal phosphate-dependent aminotransferase [Exilispira sp.]
MFDFPKRAEIADSETLKINSDVIELRKQGKDVIPLVAGEPDFETPELIKDKAREALNKDITRYTPTSGMLELREKIVEKLKKENNIIYEPSEIVVGCGAKQNIATALMALTDNGDEVIIPSPYWVSYKAMAEIAGSKPVIAETDEKNNFKLTVDDLKKVLTRKSKILILNSPSNPTGIVYSEEELKQIAEFVVKNNLIVISDEIYEKLIYDGKKHISIASLGKDIFERTIVINGFSKSCAMTGWRVGYSAAPKKFTDVFKKIQANTTTHTSSISQYAALAAFDLPENYYSKNAKTFEERRNFIANWLDNRNELSYIKPEGAFYFFINISKIFGKKIKDTIIFNDNIFYSKLLENNLVAVVPGSAFGNKNYIRISYSYSLDSIEKALNRIGDFLNACK